MNKKFTISKYRLDKERLSKRDSGADYAKLFCRPKTVKRTDTFPFPPHFYFLVLKIKGEL